MLGTLSGAQVTSSLLPQPATPRPLWC